MITAAGKPELAMRSRRDERVHAGAVFVVHLRVLARLRERVRLVDEEDDAAAGLAGSALELWQLRRPCARTRRKEAASSHPRGPGRASRGSRKERDVDAFLPRHGIADGLGEFGLARPTSPASTTSGGRRRMVFSRPFILGWCVRAQVSSPVGFASNAKSW